MFNALLRLPFASKCALAAALLCAVSALVLMGASLRASHMLLEQATDIFGTHIARQLANQAQQPLLSNDRVSLQAILSSHVDNPLINHAAIADGAQNLIAEAGENGSEDKSFTAPVTLGRDVAGTASVALDMASLGNEVRILGWQLLLLTAVLTGIGYTVIAVLGRRIEHWLQGARRQLLQPLAEPTRPDYPGEDALGDLLSTIYRSPIPELRDSEQSVDRVVLHVRWLSFGRLQQQWGRSALDRQLARSYRQAAVIAKLYHGELLIRRADGISLHFENNGGADHPLFRALCCAHLLNALDTTLGASARIGLLRRKAGRWQIEAAESALLDGLHQQAADAGAIALQLPSEEKAQLEEWADVEDSRVGAIHAPYDELLTRQLSRLEKLDNTF